MQSGSSRSETRGDERGGRRTDEPARREERRLDHRARDGRELRLAGPRALAAPEPERLGRAHLQLARDADRRRRRGMNLDDYTPAKREEIVQAHELLDEVL